MAASSNSQYPCEEGIERLRPAVGHRSEVLAGCVTWNVTGWPGRARQRASSCSAFGQPSSLGTPVSFTRRTWYTRASTCGQHSAQSVSKVVKTPQAGSHEASARVRMQVNVNWDTEQPRC